MFKYIYSILVVLLLGNLAYAQNATPSRYTTFIGLRCYASGANAGADSLNANWDDIDSTVEALNDSIAAIKADVYSVIDYAGGVIDGTVMWADMSTSAKATIVQVTGTQSIAGAKTFTDNMNTESILPVEDATYNLGSISKQWYRGYFKSLRTHQLYVINPVDTSEKAEITFDGGTVTFDKPLELNKDVVIKDSTKFSAIALSGNYWTPVLTTDSVIVLDSTMSSLYIDNKSFALPNIERITMTGAGHEQILVITGYTGNATTFEDTAPDGNLHLSSNFALSADDVLTLKYNVNAGYWVEVSRSNN